MTVVLTPVWTVAITLQSGRVGAVTFPDATTAFTAYTAAVTALASDECVNVTNETAGGFAAAAKTIESIALSGP